jgi:glycosyltransferase involved in cell wall biosynthesis
MMILATACLLGALVPCVLFLHNLLLYRVPATPRAGQKLPFVSVLIPARDEESNIGPALDSVLANRGVGFEVIVLNDHSIDRTALIVEEFAQKDPRVRLETAPPLPQGWCGKQHSCAALAGHASFPLLVFMDADVRLSPNALARMAAYVTEHDVSLASGVPRQEFGTFWEKTLIPLIHFVLLGFLPMGLMRRNVKPAFAAGCGQLFIARAADYYASGGHGMIRESLHDGLQLPRIFRQHGFKTDLFDATPLASCRMYRNADEVFAGLGKNAVEGLAAPNRIFPFTALLGFGQVLPFVLLAIPGLPWSVKVGAACAALLAWLPRWIACFRFDQPWLSALLHPFGVVVLLGIQWRALMLHRRGHPAHWRGRSYVRPAALLLLMSMLIGSAGHGTNAPASVPDFTLVDQYGVTNHFTIPRTNLSFIVVADQKGSDQLPKWIQPVHDQHGGAVAILGVADLGTVPGPLRPLVRRAFVKNVNYPVLLDWSGVVAKLFRPVPKVANIYLVRTNGTVAAHWSGPASKSHLEEVSRVIRLEQP